MTKEREEAIRLVVNIQFSEPPFMFEDAKRIAIICEKETIKRIRGLKISGFTVAECNKYSSLIIKEIESL